MKQTIIQRKQASKRFDFVLQAVLTDDEQILALDPKIAKAGIKTEDLSELLIRQSGKGFLAGRHYERNATLKAVRAEISRCNQEGIVADKSILVKIEKRLGEIK